MSTEPNKTTDRRLVEEALSRGNLAVADELVAPDFVDHAAPPGMRHGPAGFKAAVAAFRAAFPDLQATVEEQVAEGDRVARRMTLRGTHRGELFGIPPTGKPMAMTGIHLVRFAGGRVAEHWGVNDDLGLLQQLGVLPAPGSGAPPAAAASPAIAAAATTPADLEANKAAVRRFFERAADYWRSGNAAVFDEVLPPDHVNHTPGIPPDREGFKQSIPLFRAAFPDLRIAVEDLVAEGDRVAVRVTNRGTHAGELMGIPPTGKPIAVTEIHVYRVAGGRLVERWGEWDALGLLQQLGAVPAPGQPGA